MARSSVADLVSSSEGNLKFIDYTSSWGPGTSENKEFLRGDMWEFNFTTPPNIVYYPGADIISKRLTSIQVGIDTGVNGFEKRLRGSYVVYQRTGQMTNGSLTLQFTDREDQAISYFVDDWRQKVADRDTKYSFRKDDLVAQGELKLYNSGRIKVRTLTFYNLIIRDATLDENGVAEDGSDRAEVSLSMEFEHYQRDWDNLV